MVGRRQSRSVELARRCVVVCSQVVNNGGWRSQPSPWGLTDLGYVEGRNIVLEYRYAEGKAERLPDLARELVSLKPTSSSPSAASIRQTSTTGQDCRTWTVRGSSGPAWAPGQFSCWRALQGRAG